MRPADLPIVITLALGLASASAGCLVGEQTTAVAGAGGQGADRTVDGCGGPATPIHAIQGDGLVSPEVGRVHTVEGVVVGDFQGRDQLGGFFVEAKVADQDGDPATSEGLFIHHGGAPAPDVAVGDVVRVRGRVREFHDLTELTADAIAVCGKGSVRPKPLTLPLAERGDGLESMEGMLVTVGQPLAVTDAFNLGRYGEVMLSRSPGTPFQFMPTERAEPGSAEYRQLAALNRRSRLIVDDGSTRASLGRVPYLHDATPATLRRGDETAAPVVGVLTEGFDSYRLQPVVVPTFVRSNPRPASPDPAVSAGADVVVGTFNLLNYFTTIDDGSNGARGADSAAELARQQAKLVAALCGLGADVIAVQELENNGDAGPSSAAATLAAALDRSCDGRWSFVDTGVTGANAGGAPPDAITVGILYDAERVVPVGSTALLETGAFDGLSRPPLAQAFRHPRSGEVLVVVAIHFKSKRCDDATGANRDLGDGQSCYNAARVASARQLLAWLTSDPTGTGDADVLIVGDLNSYTREDPIDALVGGGFVNLVEAHVKPRRRYSFASFGEAGLLDHALASPSLAARVTAVDVWHINADEPRALDSNDAIEDTSTGPDVLNGDGSLYAPDPYRSSDHDPVVVGFDLTAAP